MTPQMLIVGLRRIGFDIVHRRIKQDNKLPIDARLIGWVNGVREGFIALRFPQMLISGRQTLYAASRE